MTKVKPYYIIAFVVIALAVISAVFVIKNNNEDVDFILGIVHEKNVYDITVDLSGQNWDRLNNKQKSNIINKCIDETTYSEEKNIILTAKDKETDNILFEYSGKTGIVTTR